MNEKLYEYRIPIIVGVVSLNVGIGIGYILGKRNKSETYVFDRQLRSKFNVEELEDIKEISDRHNAPPVVEEKSTIINTDDAVIIDGERFLKTKLETKDEIIEINERVQEELVTKSIFNDENDNWHYPTEISKRTPNAPYVIHKDEFYADEMDYTQSTFTYYAGDNIMCDEDDSPVYNHEEVVGPLLFGHGSGDQNVVHIRNDKRKSEYEVLFDPGLYSVDVLGLEIENNQRVEDLKHSKNRKFRSAD